MLVGGLRGAHVALADGSGEPLPDRGAHGAQGDLRGECGEASEQRGVRQRSPEVLAGYLRPWAGAGGQQRWVDQVEAVQHTDTAEAVSRLASVAVPTLVLWGEEDRWLPPTVADRLAAAIPGARRHRIAGGVHFLAEDRPHEVAQAIAAFADGLPTR